MVQLRNATPQFKRYIGIDRRNEALALQVPDDCDLAFFRRLWKQPTAEHGDWIVKIGGDTDKTFHKVIKKDHFFELYRPPIKGRGMLEKMKSGRGIRVTRYVSNALPRRTVDAFELSSENLDVVKLFWPELLENGANFGDMVIQFDEGGTEVMSRTDFDDAYHPMTE